VNVLLEAAWFEPKSIRKTARYFGMHTDASHRFERGMDIGFTVTAADRAAELIQQVAGGEILRGALDAYPNPQPRAAIELRRKELDRIIGVQVPAAEVLRILRRLGFRPDELGYGNWKMIPPSWRLDVAREIDIVEEVARHYGFERLPDSLCGWAGEIHRTPNAAMERVLRDTARALGYDETIAISLVPEAKTKLFSPEVPPAIGNPLSAESAVLRTSPLPGVLDAVLWNLNHGEAESRVFEVGKIYRHAGSAYEEPPTLGLAAAPGDFLHLKGDIETILDRFECGDVTFDAATGVDYFHPARSARVTVSGETLGRFGELHPRVAAEYGFRQPVWAAEFLLDSLYRVGLRVPRHHDLPRFPAVDRDFSLLLPDGVTFQSVREAVTSLGIAELREVTAGEVFRGGQVPAGQYSLLLRVRFQSTDRTLSDAEVNAHAAAIVAMLESKFSATLRS
jgi:phenylalanyl-tRNA synthetase beta chain